MERGVNAWIDCMTIHVAELQAQANTVVEDFNTTVKEFRQQLDAQSGQ